MGSSVLTGTGLSAAERGIRADGTVNRVAAGITDAMVSSEQRRVKALGESRAEWAETDASRRRFERDAEYRDTLRMTPDARVDRWLSEAPGFETESVIELLRDMQAMFRQARARADARKAQQRASLTADELSAARSDAERLADLERPTVTGRARSVKKPVEAQQPAEVSQ